MPNWKVYKATYDGYTYYGITTDLKKRRLEHIRRYSTGEWQGLHPSVNALSRKAREIGVSPAHWDFTIIAEFDSKSDALDLKAKLVREDEASINILYKWTYHQSWYSYNDGEWKYRR